jgi:sarcosine oxidase subunit alpha
MSAFRLASGGRIDRSRTLRFRFDGGTFTGHPGDTLASALLAHGVHLMNRSFKYHRPRGPIAAGAEEPNALVSVGQAARHTPNLRATQVELYDGLEATSQNRWPSLGFDLGAAAQLAAPLLGAGFYYKTFMGPNLLAGGRAWARLYEPAIRRMAGLGTAPDAPDPDVYTQRYAHCEVLVVGAGAAGLAAALAASEHGQRVVLADEQAEFGGGLLAEADALIEGQQATDWLAATLATLAARPNVTLLPRTTAFGMFTQGYVGLCERLTDHLASPRPGRARERLWKLRAGRIVLAAGAIERPLVFADNDRPGIMLAGAARSYLNRWAVKPGSRAVLAGADDAMYAAARDLARAGVEIAAIADLRAEPGCETFGHTPRTATAIVGSIGRLRVAAADLRTAGGSVERIACDVVLMAGGWTPSLHLHSQARGKLVFDAARAIYLPGEAADGILSAGACRGLAGLAACLEDGYAAGDGRRITVTVAGEAVPRGGHTGLVPGSPTRHAFVDFQNDVQAADITQAVAEGFRSIEHVKRYTTSGMATDQGKTSNINALAIAAGALGRELPQVGLTSFRMPYTPVSFGSFAGLARGDLFDPVRHTPMHGWAQAHGAVFEDVGQWKRAHHFARPGETEAEAVARECRAVRSAAGIFDGSTLGKIEVVGPDAATFLERIYTNAWAKLAPGRCRYGVMLNEAGFVIDDGVIGRLAPDRFHVTTTTGGAASVLHHMEDYLQTEFTDLGCRLTSVTEHWAVIAVQGPRARDIIAPLVEGVDFAAFPHMSVAGCRVAGIPARLFRVSFTGEMGFEINVPAGHGQAVWEAVWASGQPHGLTAYGTEAMHVLRAEKGYIVVGQDSDGTLTPDDLGLAWTIGKAKPDFVGKRSLTRPDMLAADRMQLVGLLTENPAVPLEEGMQIVAAAMPAVGAASIGHVTSAYASAALGRNIALGLLAGGRGRMGERVHIAMPGGSVAALVCSPVFHDPEGVLLHG